MEKPNYVLRFREEVQVPKKDPKPINKVRWGFIFIVTFLIVIFNLLAFQGIYSLLAYMGLIALYIRFTFPKTKTRNRVIIWFILSLVIVFALIVEENDLLLMTAIPLYLWGHFSKELESVLVPVEIQFYDDYLIIYREKGNVSLEPRYVVREYHTMIYKDIKVVEFGQFRKSVLKFYGKVEVLRHKYNDDGTLIDEPLLHKTLENEYTNINTKESPEVDFVEKIEKYSPIKITRKADSDRRY